MGAGWVHFKLERTLCEQCLKYISLYNTEGAPFLVKNEKCICVIKIRIITLTIKHWYSRPAAETVQSWSGENRMEHRRREYSRGSGGLFAREILKFSFFKMHILRIF